MELKRTGYGAQIVQWGVVAALLVGYEAFVVARITTTGDWSGVFNPIAIFGGLFVLMLLFATVIMCAWPWLLLKRAQYSRALASRDPMLVSIASAQPDQSLALRDGETLVLSYRRSGGGWREIPVFFVVGLLLAASGEVLIFAALPVFSHSSLNPFYFELLYPPAATVPPAPLDWLAAAFPLVVCVPLLGYAVWDVIAGRATTLTADDQGVRLRQRRRSKAIPWGDIALFAHISARNPANPVGAYVLWGRKHRLEFAIASSRITELENTSRGQLSPNIFDGGYERYLADAQRLFATITARSHAPLLVMREIPMAAWLRRHAPVTTTDEAEALALPPAEFSFQPQVSESAATLAYGEQLTLKARIATGPLLGESLLWLIALGLFLLLFIRQPIFFESLFAAGPIVGYIAVAFCIALCGFAAIALAAQRRRNALPAIVVDGFGITGRATSQQKSVTVTWQNITAWVVVPAPPGSNKPARYMVFGDGNKITWAEPANAKLAGRGVKGDRRQAYRERAARIHALIATRTGLPLRELRSDAPTLLAPVK